MCSWILKTAGINKLAYYRLNLAAGLIHSVCARASACVRACGRVHVASFNPCSSTRLYVYLYLFTRLDVEFLIVYSL